MAGQVEKALKKLSPKHQLVFKKIISDIVAQNIEGYDVKKLVGADALFRIRKGKYRIIFSMKYGKVFVLSVEHRNNNTY